MQVLFATALIFGLCASNNNELYGFYEYFFMIAAGCYIIARMLTVPIYSLYSRFWDNVDHCKEYGTDSRLLDIILKLLPNLKEFKENTRY